MEPYNILIVDDEVGNLNALKRVFRNEYNVLSATNGQDAIILMQQNEIALIIADHRMPGMTGVEFLEKMSQDYPDAIRIILTAYTDEKLVMDAINMGHVHAYITKPWEPDEVRTIVKEQIEIYERTRIGKEETRSEEQTDSESWVQIEEKIVGESLSEHDVIPNSQRIEALEKVLRDPDESVRQKAAESLSRIEARADFSTYTQMLDSDDRADKIQAIYFLAELATDAAIELLRLQMSDPYDDVRGTVVHALRDSSDNYRTDEMREKAVDIVLMGLGDLSLAIRTSAADALANFKDARSTVALLKVIASSAVDESEDVQLVVSALLALGEIGDRKAVPGIIEKAKADNPEIKEAVLKVLGILGDPRAEDCLIEALTDDSPRVRMQAAESLSKI